MTDLQPVFQQAKQLWLNYQRPCALSLLADCCAAHPLSVDAWMEYGKILATYFRAAPAENAFAHALLHGGNQPELMLRIARCWNFTNHHGRAIDCFTSLHSRNALSAAELVEAAQCAERANQADFAEALLEEIAHHGDIRNAPEVLLVEAKICNRRRDHERARTILRQSLQRPPSSQKYLHAALYYELGKSCDRLELAAEAMEAWTSAKAQFDLPLLPTPESVHACWPDYKKIHAKLKKIHYTRWKKEACHSPKWGRLVLLTGSPRSGTTLLERLLEESPGVHSMDETNFFKHDFLTPMQHAMTQASPRKKSPDFEELLLKPPAELANAMAHRFYEACAQSVNLTPENYGATVIDKSPDRTSTLFAMARFFPTVPILRIDRDPRDTVLSTFGLDNGPRREMLVWQSLESIACNTAIVRSFWKQLQPIIENPIHCLRYENLIVDKDREMEKVRHFLGIAAPEVQKPNGEGRIALSPTYADAAKPVYQDRSGRWKLYQKWLDPVMRYLEPLL